MVIYISENVINSKKYIGKDKNNNPEYLGSGLLLRNAIKEYLDNGWIRGIKKFNLK